MTEASDPLAAGDTAATASTPAQAIPPVPVLGDDGTPLSYAQLAAALAESRAAVASMKRVLGSAAAQIKVLQAKLGPASAPAGGGKR